MNIKVRWVSRYVSVILEHDSVTVDLGLLNDKERRELRDELKTAWEGLTND
jgi:hypothetical protein